MPLALPADTRAPPSARWAAPPCVQSQTSIGSSVLRSALSNRSCDPIEPCRVTSRRIASHRVVWEKGPKQLRFVRPPPPSSRLVTDRRGHSRAIGAFAPPPPTASDDRLPCEVADPEPNAMHLSVFTGNLEHRAAASDGRWAAPVLMSHRVYWPQPRFFVDQDVRRLAWGSTVVRCSSRKGHVPLPPSWQSRPMRCFPRRVGDHLSGTRHHVGVRGDN